MQYRKRPFVIDAEQWWPGKEVAGVCIDTDDAVPGAHRCHTGQTTYSKLVNRERNLGRDVANKIVMRYPELKQAVAEYMLIDAVAGKQAAGK